MCACVNFSKRFVFRSPKIWSFDTTSCEAQTMLQMLIYWCLVDECTTKVLVDMCINTLFTFIKWLGAAIINNNWVVFCCIHQKVCWVTPIQMSLTWCLPLTASIKVMQRWMCCCLAETAAEANCISLKVTKKCHNSNQLICRTEGQPKWWCAELYLLVWTH